MPKKGDLSKSGNYRGISLNAIVTKLINRMILNRIQPVLDPYLRPNQNGFRPGRSTTSQILALNAGKTEMIIYNQPIEKVNSMNGEEI